MQNAMASHILKRVGAVLIIVGILGICWMIYCIENRISYFSSFNIFALIAGFFLYRGSLRAASVVRRVAAFVLSGATPMLIFGLPLVYPPPLALLEIRLAPVILLTFGMAIALCLLPKALFRAFDFQFWLGVYWESDWLPLWHFF
jgi:hypothetical protein